MKQHSYHFRSYQAGFSLIELMVGLTIGLLATLVITQVMSGFEVQKRVTTGSADAQTNGSIALYDIGRELKMAGYGLLPITNSAYDCTATTIDGIAETPANRNSLLLSPVIITDGNSDTITIRYGNSSAGGIPSQIATVTPLTLDPKFGGNFGCAASNRTLITSPTGCAMSNANTVSTTDNISLTLNDTTGVVVGANLACLGTWNTSTYSVINGILYNQLNGAAATPVMEGIVNLQAQYGISASAGSNLVTQWVDATGIWDANAITVANRNLIKAIRIAVVARNSKRQISNVTDTCSSYTTAAPIGLCAWDATIAQPANASPAPAINLAFTDPNWQQYRYRVFSAIIPLQNMIWAGTTATGQQGTLQ